MERVVGNTIKPIISSDSMIKENYTAAPRQKGITDNFVKIELSPLPGPEWQYLSVGIIKHPILDL